MGRKFIGASSNRIHVGTAAGLAGFDFRWGTLAMCLNLASTPGVGVGCALFSVNGGTFEVTINNSGTGAQVDVWDNTIDRTALTGSFATNTHYVLVFTKATGAATSRLHLYVFSTNTWTHVNASGTSADAAANTSLTIGSDSDSASVEPLDGEVFAVGAWPAYVLSDLEVERLSRGDWGWLNPGFWDQWDTSRDSGDMLTTLGRYPVKQTARTGAVRGTLAPPPGFRMSPVRHRR